jgi:hypothetical protein
MTKKTEKKTIKYDSRQPLSRLGFEKGISQK